MVQDGNALLPASMGRRPRRARRVAHVGSSDIPTILCLYLLMVKVAGVATVVP